MINRKENDMADVSEARKNFVERATNRTNRAVTAIHSIGKLSNPKTYEFSEKDVAKIVKALKDATTETDSKFRAALAGKKSGWLEL